jgi:hypothetical protein
MGTGQQRTAAACNSTDSGVGPQNGDEARPASIPDKEFANAINKNARHISTGNAIPFHRGKIL